MNATFHTKEHHLYRLFYQQIPLLWQLFSVYFLFFFFHFFPCLFFRSFLFFILFVFCCCCCWCYGRHWIKWMKTWMRKKNTHRNNLPVRNNWKSMRNKGKCTHTHTLIIIRLKMYPVNFNWSQSICLELIACTNDKYKQPVFPPGLYVTMHSVGYNERAQIKCVYVHKQDTAHTLCHNQKSLSTKSNEYGTAENEPNATNNDGNFTWIRNKDCIMRKTCGILHSNWNINFGLLK